MAVRDDVVIDWNQSPRVVTVLSPTVYIGMLDLYQTLRWLERQPYNLEKPYIVDGFGQFYLDPQQNYGRIVQLQNAQLKFEDRAGPTWTDCTIEANLVAVDEVGTPIKAYQNADFVNVVQYLDGSAILLQAPALDTIPLIKTDTETIITDVASVQGDVTTLLSDVASVQGDVTSLLGDAATIISAVATVDGHVLEIREKNIRRYLVRATADDATRNVSIGDWDHEVVVVKDDAAGDWSSPLWTGQRKVAYEYAYNPGNPALGHDRPFFYIGAD